MPSSTPRNVAIRTALYIAGSSLLLMLVAKLIRPDSAVWGVVFGIPVLLFILAFVLISWTVERFIYQKVKIIYKTIHRLKRTGKHEIQMNEDVLEEVQKDVRDWADERVKEIRDLRKADSFRRDFIGNLSHELKTPMFNIQGYILTLLEGALEDPEHNRVFLQKAAKSVDRMVVLLDDLDAITQMESDNVSLNRTDFDITKLAREVVEAMEHKANKSKIAIHIHSPEDRVIMVNADISRMEQVLTNLLVNSIKYGKPNGETKIRFYDLDDNVLVEVADDGIGMKEEHLPRVFERFYRVDKSRSRHHGGTGLGLAIVKHLVEAHDQTINVRSTDGVGSTFSFTLKKA